MIPVIILLAIIFAAIVGAIGADRKIGFWNAFILSLILSPIIGLIIVLFSGSKSELEMQGKMLEVNEKQQKTLEEIKNSSAQVSVADEIKKLKDLYDQGIITQEEFNQGKQKILTQK